MPDLFELLSRDERGQLRVVVETPAGSRVKLKYDLRTQTFLLSRQLPLGFVYPFDWGFVPHTRAPDGDPLDAMVLSDGPTPVGTILACHPLGILELEQKSKNGGRERNDRLLVLPLAADRFAGLTSVLQLPARFREELAYFFKASTYFAGKEVQVLDWQGPAVAERAVAQTKI